MGKDDLIFLCIWTAAWFSPLIMLLIAEVFP
jgi:hypothetical protein